MPTTSSYGTWESPLSSKIACDSSIKLSRLYADKHHHERIYWNELHPTEKGHTIVFSKGKNSDVNTAATRCTPEGYDVYDMVHEYGGAAFVVDRNRLFFQNLKTADGNNDNKIYCQTDVSDAPEPVTKKSSEFRYADADFTTHKDYMFCVREDHSQKEAKQAENVLVVINTKTGDEKVVASGNDFYSSPRVSPDGTKVAWVTWVHPNMPWDDTEIWVSEFSLDHKEIIMGTSKKVAGETGVNFMEPSWTSDNKLLYICDRTGWWNLYRVDDLVSGVATCVYEAEQEIGGPCWSFGNRSFSPNPKNADQVCVLYSSKPSLLSLSEKAITKTIDIGNSYATSCVFLPDGETVFFQVLSSKEPTKIVKYSLASEALIDFHYSAKVDIDTGYLSDQPQTFKFPTSNDDPNDPNQVLHAFGHFYPPKNQDFIAPEGELPPVLVKVHGGPTSAASHAMDLQKQYFTSRGIAIFDLDYRGSTGYGTPFRNALKGKWGVYDLNDAVCGVEYLASINLIDPKKALISGGSAGGYTALACLTFKNTDETTIFATGASYYGISNLVSLAIETHKFESRYLDTMVAPYPECEAVYNDRSPLVHKDKFKTPCAFFQGALDEVVPPKQSEEMYNELLNTGEIPCSYVLFEGEYHGFKKSENKQKALDGEFYFYSVMLEFEPADNGIEIPIENLPEEKTKMVGERKRKCEE